MVLSQEMREKYLIWAILCLLRMIVSRNGRKIPHVGNFMHTQVVLSLGIVKITPQTDAFQTKLNKSNNYLINMQSWESVCLVCVWTVTVGLHKLFNPP